MASKQSGRSKASKRDGPGLGEDDRRRVRRVFELRPDLLLSQRTGSLSELERAAQGRVVLAHCLQHLNRFELEVLEVLMTRGGIGSTEVARLAGADEDAVVGALRSLEEHWLVRRHDDVWRTPNFGSLNVQHPAGLGRRWESLAREVSVAELNTGLQKLGLPLTAGKAKSVGAFIGWASDLQAVQALVAAAPLAVQDLLERLAAGPPTVDVPFNYGRRSPVDPAIRWLSERGLLLPSRWGVYELPRELGIALRGGRVVPDAMVAPPEVATQPIDPATEPTSEVVHRSVTLVAQIDDVCRSIEASPLRCLKAGGLGVREVRRLSAELKVDEADMRLFLELAGAAGLVAPAQVVVERPPEKGKRRAEPDVYVELQASQRLSTWRDQSMGHRWMILARSWLTVRRHLSSAGGRDQHGRTVNVLDLDHAEQAYACRRWALLEALRDLGAVRVTADPSVLSAYVSWHSYRLFAGPTGSEVVGELLDEATRLGVVHDGALTTPGAELFAGRFDAAAGLVDADALTPTDKFMVQADGSVIIGGVPDGTMLADLQAFADVESRDSAIILRITERSIHRALDAGRTPNDLLAFLDRHASHQVPQAVQYLVQDVARRHGNLKVGPARSFLRSDDPAVIADVVRHRAMVKHGMRAIAPTVAVSAAEPDVVMDALRAAGFLPVMEVDAPGAGVVSVESQSHRAPARPAFEDLRVAHMVDLDVEALIDEMAVGEPASQASPIRPTMGQDVSWDDDELDDDSFDLVHAAVSGELGTADVLQAIVSEVLVSAGRAGSRDELRFGPMVVQRQDIAAITMVAARLGLPLAVGVWEEDLSEASVSVIRPTPTDDATIAGVSMTSGEQEKLRYSDVAWLMTVQPVAGLEEWNA